MDTPNWLEQLNLLSWRMASHATLKLIDDATMKQTFARHKLVNTLLAAMSLWASMAAHAQICTREYMPMCGQVAGEPAPKTFGNRCMLAAAKATLVSEGQCQATPSPAPTPLAGSDVDTHGCKPSAGFLWNKELASCVRPWMSSAVTLEVAAHRRLCTGLVEVQCLLVRELSDGPDKPEWMPLYNRIQGFNPAPGVHYTVRVRKDRTENPPADASDTTYTLMEVLRPHAIRH